MNYENMWSVLKAQDKKLGGMKVERMLKETEINHKSYRHTIHLKVKWHCIKGVAEN